MTSGQSRVAPIPSQLVMDPIDVGDLMKKIQTIVEFAIDYCSDEMCDIMDLRVIWDTPGFKKNVCISWSYNMPLGDGSPESQSYFRLWRLGRLMMLKHYLDPHFKTDFVLHPGLQGADMTISTLD
jgi:hypothetical protein